MELQEYNEIIEDLKRRKLPGEVKTTVKSMLDNKAEDVVVLKIKEVSDVTDYMVICNGNSERHNRAISDEVQRQLKKELKIKSINVEGEDNGKWILIDYTDFVVHIFTSDNRIRFSLEKLWMDGKRYDFFKG